MFIEIQIGTHLTASCQIDKDYSMTDLEVTFHDDYGGTKDAKEFVGSAMLEGIEVELRKAYLDQINDNTAFDIDKAKRAIENYNEYHTIR